MADTKYFAVTPSGSGETFNLFLPGPYGAIITHFTMFNFTWMGAGNRLGGVGLWEELGDATTNTMRLGQNVFVPVHKIAVNNVHLGLQGGVGAAAGGFTYFLCPSTWGKVADANTYLFRDDFMGTSLDTSTEWTRAQSTAGNVEIDTNFNWLKVQGNNNWGTNGCFSQTATSRATGKKFLCDVYVPLEGNVNNHNQLVGWHDGSDQNYPAFVHGLLFSTASSVRRLNVFENGNNRGNVGANPGFTEGHTYRVRITLNGNAAIYEIQGGPEYEPMGGSSWTDITPGTTSSSTTPLAIGVTRHTQGNLPYYVSDMRMIG